MFRFGRNSICSALLLGVGGLFALCDVFSAATFFFFWAGGIQALNWAAQHFGSPRIVHWLHAMTFEPLALFGVPFMRLSRVVNPALGGKKPILLIHGYMNHGSVWTLQRKRLEALGFGPIYTINLGHPFRAIADYAEKIKVKAEAIAKETGCEDLILIGHSMGGLVAAWYATQLAPPNKVQAVITIGSPLAGTPIAYMGLGPNAKEMRRNSPFLKELQQAFSKSGHIRFYHIATRCDQIVIPGISAALLQNEHLILDDIGHASLLYSRRVTQKIAEWLARSS